MKRRIERLTQALGRGRLEESEGAKTAALVREALSHPELIAELEQRALEEDRAATEKGTMNNG